MTQAIGAGTKLCVPCLAVGEERPAKAKRLCNAHYGRQYRSGDITSPIRKALPAECLFDPCDHPSSGRNGYCPGHTSQLKRGKPLAPLRKYTPRKGHCQASACIPRRPAVNDGLCRAHYDLRRWGDPDWDRPIATKAPAGSGHTDKNGYRFITHNGRKRAEHRVFAEQTLDRPLLPTEDVHHKNGNRSDNTTGGPFALDDRGRLLSGNLEIWSTSQPKGQEIGPKLAWAVDLLVTYGQFDPDTLRAVLAVHGDERERAAYLELSPLAQVAA